MAKLTSKLVFKKGAHYTDKQSAVNPIVSSHPSYSTLSNRPSTPSGNGQK